MRDFCKPIETTEEDRKKWRELPKFEFDFNHRGKCFIKVNGKVVAIQKKDGTYIEVK